MYVIFLSTLVGFELNQGRFQQFIASILACRMILNLRAYGQRDVDNASCMIPEVETERWTTHLPQSYGRDDLGG